MHSNSSLTVVVVRGEPALTAALCCSHPHYQQAQRSPDIEKNCSREIIRSMPVLDATVLRPCCANMEPAAVANCRVRTTVQMQGSVVRLP